MDNKDQIYTNNNDEEVEIDLVEMALELLDHWKIILFSTVFVALITFSYFKYAVTPLYQSTADLYMLDSSNIISSLTDIQIGNNLATDYVKVIQSRPVIDRVISNLKLNETYKEFSKRLTVTNETNTHILNISIKDENPEEAKKIVDELANVSKTFIADKMGQKEPSILHLGYIEYDKVYPSTLRNTIIGGLVGFVISSGFVIAMWLFNDTIRIEEDVEKKLGLVVLGSIPYEEAEDDSLKNKRQKKSKRKAGNK